MLKLYSQPFCPFCDLMKDMLNEVNIKFHEINIKEDSEALTFIKEMGHKTVPQLYYNDIHVNKKSDTREYTSSELQSIIYDVMDQTHWPGIDSGIEQGI